MTDPYNTYVIAEGDARDGYKAAERAAWATYQSDPNKRFDVYSAEVDAARRTYHAAEKAAAADLRRASMMRRPEYPTMAEMLADIRATLDTEKRV